MSETVGLITARGGSKSIPKENIKMLAGNPFIVWTIDNDKIAEVAREWGAEVPIIRPAELGCDDSSSISAVLHAIHWMEENEGFSHDYFMPQERSLDVDTPWDWHMAELIV